MDDLAEFRSSDPRLQEALSYLHARLLPPWQEADTAAIRQQFWHRRVAKAAIFFGSAAVVLAIIQMAVERQSLVLASWALRLEVSAAVGAACAVLVGVIFRMHRRWLLMRHRAERLRILKFKSLGWPSLWSSNTDAWKQQLTVRLDELVAPKCVADADPGANADVMQLKEWASHDSGHPELAAGDNRTMTPSQSRALVDYYQSKRLRYQSAYFKDRAERCASEARPWRHLSVPFFAASLVCVVIHVVANWLDRETANHSEHAATASFVKYVEVWSLALAAIIPVIGLGARVWLGAFEPHRSANLFAAKRRALEEMSARLEHDREKPAAVLSHIALAEHFLENEHREWLRLMLETEWML